MASLSDRLSHILVSKNEAALRSGRDPQSITLIAVSKKKSPLLIDEAIHAGQIDFGENYAQELLEKQKTLPSADIRWHFIGHLQRRKARDIVGRVHLIHSVDSLELAREIDKQATQKGVIQKCLLQLNLAGEESKSGASEKELVTTVTAMNDMAHVELEGLMIIPPFEEDAEKIRPYFRQLRQCREAINQKSLYRKPLLHLSMGMSHDFPIAIEEGATLIRVGEAIFGKRE